MFHIMQARSRKRGSLTRQQIMSLFTGGRWQQNVVFVVCERLLFGYFPTVWIFPNGFFPQSFFPCRCVGPPC